MDITTISTECLLKELNNRYSLMSFKKKETVSVCVAVEHGMAEVCQYIPQGIILSTNQFENIRMFVLEWQCEIYNDEFYTHRISKLGICPDSTLLCYFTKGDGSAFDAKMAVYLDSMCNIHRFMNTTQETNPELARIMNQEDISFFLNLKK